MRCRRLIPSLTLLLSLATPAWGGNLSVSKSVAPNPAPAGAPVTWTLRITNPDAAARRDVTLRDVLPAGVTEIAASSEVFACQVNALAVECRAVSLPAGESIISITGIAPSKAQTVSAAPMHDQSRRAAAMASATTSAGAASRDAMETIANLRITIGTLESERDAANARTEGLESSLKVEQESSKRIAGELEERRVEISELKERVVTAESRAASLADELGRSSADATALQEQLRVAREEVASTMAVASSSEASRSQLLERLAAADAELQNAAPLSFGTDCPAEAESQKWLLANLPGLLETAIANPTPRNTRAFLCAQRAATTHGDFGRTVVATKGAFVPSPASRVTDGKLRMHKVFANTPSPADIESMRKDAMRGSAEAMNDLGVLSLVGEGVPFDQSLAERNLSAAAAGGSALAAANLAVMFDRGVGVNPDAPAATQWRRYANAMDQKGP